MICSVDSVWKATGLCGVWLVFATNAVVQAQGEADTQFSNTPEKTTLSTAEVHIPFDLQRNKIFIEAMINGHGPYPMLFDTGTSLTVLDRSLTQELGLETVGTTEVGDSSSSTRLSADVVSINKLSIGAMTATGIQATSWERRHLYQGMANPPRGIIGFPFFHDYLLTIDYEAENLIVQPGSLTPDMDHVKPFTTPLGVAMTTCLVNGKPIDTYLDTGGPHGIMIPREALPGDAIHGEPIVIGRARTVTSDFEVKAASVKGLIEIAGHKIHDPDILFNELNSAVILGYAALKHFRLTFDQINELIQFVPVSMEPITVRIPQLHAAAPDPGDDRLYLGQSHNAAELRIEIEAVSAKLSNAMLGARDMEAIASFYADDAIMVDDAGTLVKGREAIVQYWSQVPEIIDWVHTTHFVDGSKSLMVQRGRSELTLKVGGGEHVSSVEFTQLWQRQSDGSLKIVVDGYWTADPTDVDK